MANHVTVPSLTSARVVYLKKYIERHCPGTEIEMLALSGQMNALVGIAAGQRDAATIDYATMLAFENEEHVGVHALAQIYRRVSGLHRRDKLLRAARCWKKTRKQFKTVARQSDCAPTGR